MVDPREIERVEAPLNPYQRFERALWMVAGFTLGASVLVWALLLLFYGRA